MDPTPNRGHNRNRAYSGLWTLDWWRRSFHDHLLSLKVHFIFCPLRVKGHNLRNRPCISSQGAKFFTVLTRAARKWCLLLFLYLRSLNDRCATEIYLIMIASKRARRDEVRISKNWDTLVVTAAMIETLHGKIFTFPSWAIIIYNEECASMKWSTGDIHPAVIYMGQLNH